MDDAQLIAATARGRSLRVSTIDAGNVGCPAVSP
jgi:hypothetical protein